MTVVCCSVEASSAVRDAILLAVGGKTAATLHP